MDKTKFDTIFLDATVIDVDLSQWDWRVRLVVIALEETDLVMNGVLPTYSVDFLKATEFNLQIHHLDKEVDGHYRWNAYLKAFRNDNGVYVVSLSSSPELATLQVRCKDINITPIEKSLIDKVNPGWAAPKQPLARPGIVELAEKILR